MTLRFRSNLSQVKKRNVKKQMVLSNIEGIEIQLVSTADVQEVRQASQKS